MKERFKSALDRIEADEALVSRTETRLRTDFAWNQAPSKVVKRRMNEMKKFAIAACVALLLLVGGGFVYSTPTSYLCVDINPSIELGINPLGRVISATALNDDGDAILTDVDVIGMKVNRAVNLIVDAAVDKGYIEKDDTSFVELTAVTDDQTKAGKLLKDAEEGTNEALKKNEVGAQVGQAAVSHARAAEAKALGISPGRMNLFQKWWEAENQTAATADDMDEIAELAEDNMDYSVKQIQQEIKAIRGNGNPNLKSQDSDDDDYDDVTPAKGNGNGNGNGKGKATAPGQLKKMNGSADNDQVVYLPNGKIKKNGQGAGGIDDNDDDEDDEDDDEDDD